MKGVVVLGLVAGLGCSSSGVQGADAWLPKAGEEFALVDDGGVLEWQAPVVTQVADDSKTCNMEPYKFKDGDTSLTAKRGCQPINPDRLPYQYDENNKPEFANGWCYTGTNAVYNKRNSGERGKWMFCKSEPRIVMGEWPEGATTVTTPQGATLNLPAPGTECAKRWNYNRGTNDDGSNDLPDYVVNSCLPVTETYYPDDSMHSEAVKNKLKEPNTYWCFTGTNSDGTEANGYNPNKDPEQKQVNWGFCVNPNAVEETGSPSVSPSKAPTGSPTGEGETPSPSVSPTSSPFGGNGTSNSPTASPTVSGANFLATGLVLAAACAAALF